MRSTSTTLFLLLLPSLPVAAAATPLPPQEKVLRVIDTWLKQYRANKIEFSSQADIGDSSLARKNGLLPKGMIGPLTARRELEILLDQAAALQTAEAAESILTVAGIGLAHGRVDYRLEMAPFAVRAVGEAALAKLTSPEAIAQLVKYARGEVKPDPTYGTGLEAAAVRWAGTRKDGSLRGLVEERLGSPEVAIRLAAVEALQQLADEAAVPALTLAVTREQNEVVLGTLAKALRACLARYVARPTPPEPAAAAPAPAAPAPAVPTSAPLEPAKPPKPDAAEPAASTPPAATPAPANAPAPGPDAATPAPQSPPQPAAPPAPPPAPPSATLAARAVIGALGRTSWRADMELVAFLADFRIPEAIPALIGVLQRFADRPQDIADGKLSGLLLYRAHETLVAMTGAVFGADKPQQWRELWEQEKEKLLVADKRAAKAHAPTTITFCGLPVQGTRILFIVDLSGSMNFKMKVERRTTTGKDQKDIAHEVTRLDYAKKQLTDLIEQMPEVAQLNFITYNGEADARVWQKDLLQATKKGKQKALDFVESMVADGGTNMWAGLQEGLRVKSLVYGDRYETAVDEIFVVSDGAPSVGEITDPHEILRLVTETNRFSGIRINTIFITSPNERNPKDATMSPNELMRRMAEQNGGRFIQHDA